MKNIWHKHIFRLLHLLLLPAAFLFSCEKEEPEHQVQYEDFSSVVGREAKTLKFFSNSSGVADELLPWIHIPDGCFTGETRILLDYLKLSSKYLPDSLTAVSSSTAYIWFFESQDQSPLKEMSITIPYPVNLEEKMLEPYENHFQLFRFRKEASGLLGALEAVEHFVLDTALNHCTVSSADLSYGYALLFPEIVMNDHVIIQTWGEVFSSFRHNEIVQHHLSSAYFSTEEDFRLGFHVRNDSSHYTMFGYYGDFITLLDFSFPGSLPGTFRGEEVKVECWMIYWPDLFTIELFEFFGTRNTKLEVMELGEMGEMVRGTITGELLEPNLLKNADFYIHFDLKRTR